MRAKVIHATIDPRRLPAAVDAVRRELGPGFLSHPGARHGYWMADPATGHLLAVTLWDSEDHLVAAAAHDGAQRAEIAERIGLRILSVQRMDVIGALEEPMSAEPDLRWVRATWVAGLHPDVHGHLPQLYREAVPDQARSRGFCASYWLGDLETGSGLGLSMWEGPAELSASEMRSARRRRRFEELLECTVHAVAEYQALGVAQERRRPAEQAPVGTAPLTQEVPLGARLGTTIERPPGALLAVRGERSHQVVVLLDGRAALVHRDDLLPMVRGAHFGADAVVHRRATGTTVVATSPVQVHVLSRLEFAELADRAPAVAADLVSHDLDR